MHSRGWSLSGWQVGRRFDLSVDSLMDTLHRWCEQTVTFKHKIWVNASQWPLANWPDDCSMPSGVCCFTKYIFRTWRCTSIIEIVQPVILVRSRSIRFHPFVISACCNFLCTTNKSIFKYYLLFENEVIESNSYAASPTPPPSCDARWQLANAPLIAFSYKSPVLSQLI